MGTHAPWKRVETAIAARLGGERIPVSGRQRGDQPDIRHDTLSVEVKLRGSLPGWLTDAMNQATAASRDGRIPLVVLHPKGGRHADDLCVLALADLAALVGRDGDA